MKIFFILIIIFFCNIKCDLPVHCLQSQVLGEWQFEITEIKQKEGILNNPCGHQFPDNEETSYLAMKDTFVSNQKITVTLKIDSTVDYNQDEPLFKDNSQNQESNTFWTMIYDEGFEIRIKDHRFFTFSEYFKNPSPSSKSDKYLSNCAKTLVGWYKKENSNLFACVRGHKTNNVDIINHQEEKLWVVEGEVTVMNREEHISKNIQPSEQVLNDNIILQIGASISQFVKGIKDEIQDIMDEAKLSVLHIIEENFIEPKQNATNSKQDDKKIQQNTFLKPPKDSNNTSSMFRLKQKNKIFSNKMNLNSNFKMHSMIASRINKLHSEGRIKWKAEAYDMFKDMTIGQINMFSGMKRSSIKSQNKKREDVSDLESQLTFEQYLKPAVSQKKCGSCYAVTTLAMYQARLKFKYNMDVTLSVQHVLDCSFYNQGCNGGFEYLVGKFAHEHYMFEDNCKPYNGQKQRFDCRQLRCNPDLVNRVFKVDEYYNIGYKFGGCSEREMMLEMKKHGPIAVSFEPDYMFSMYKGGIYSFGNNNDYMLKGLPKPEWTKVDHAVLCYGWGEDEDGTKYWLLQNSWGKNWGENGNFRMLRGVDSGGIEAMCEAGHVSVINLHENPEVKQEIKSLYKQR